MPAQRRTVRLTDPRAMRALAHPTRLRLLGELRARGPQSVGQLSELIDEAVGSVSYHLGNLASHGFVEEAPELARDRRERWWRAAHERTTWDELELLDDPERYAALGTFRQAILGRYLEKLQGYLRAEPALAPEWVAAHTSGDESLHLTSDELAQLRDELEELAARWQARGSHERPGTRRVTLIYHAFPSP